MRDGLLWLDTYAPVVDWYIMIDTNANTASVIIADNARYVTMPKDNKNEHPKRSLQGHNGQYNLTLPMNFVKSYVGVNDV